MGTRTALRGIACAAAAFAALACDSGGRRRGGGTPRGDGGSADARGDGVGGDAGPAREACGNMLDDDADGSVDEGCSCHVPATQECATTREASLRIGACRPGFQQCVQAGEFGEWGDCVMEVTPTPEPAECDGVDDDCNGITDDGADCPPACDPGEIPEPEICDDFEDNDCDGLWDCADPDCAAISPCGEPDCPEIPEFVACGDGCDNDGNGNADCDDFVCMLSRECRECAANEFACMDGWDDDCDGDRDCADPDCAGEDCEPCVPGECKWWHVCGCCEDPMARGCPPDSCESPHLKYFVCEGGNFVCYDTIYDCEEGDVPPDCDSIHF